MKIFKSLDLAFDEDKVIAVRYYSGNSCKYGYIRIFLEGGESISVHDHIFAFNDLYKWYKNLMDKDA